LDASLHPGDSPDVRVPLWVWFILALLAFAVRAAFILKGHPAFDSDEALDFMYLRQWAGVMAPENLDAAVGRASGLRLFTGSLAFRFAPNQLFAASYLAAALSVVGTIPWILWLDRTVSRRAALAAAVALTLAPLSIAYYGTMFQRRLFTQLFGGILVLFCGRWLRTRIGSWSLGFLVGWVFFEEFFSAFISVPVLVYELFFVRGNSESFLRRVSWLGFGIAVGGAYGLGLLWKGGDLDPTATSFGLVSWDGMVWHFRMLIEVFPQFLNGNFSFGNLQYSSLGQAVDPMAGGFWKGFWWVWTLVLFLSTVFGFWSCRRNVRRKGMPTLWLAFPAIAYVVFFVVSSQVVDFRSLRYLNFILLFLCLGFGMVAHSLAKCGKNWFVAVLLAWALVNGYWTLHRLVLLPRQGSFQVIQQALEDRGLRSGYANSWVSEGVRYLSRDRFLLNPTNVPPVSREAFQAAHRDKRIALVLVDSMDSPEKSGQIVSEIEKSGYRPTGRYRFEIPGWSIVEFERVKGKDAIEGLPPKG
jgi:hypothetical protein